MSLNRIKAKTTTTTTTTTQEQHQQKNNNNNNNQRKCGVKEFFIAISYLIVLTAWIANVEDNNNGHFV